MRRVAVAAVGAAVVAPLAAAAAAAAPSAVPRATPGATSTGIPLLAPVRNVDPLANAGALGLRKDRLRKSVVPGPVSDTESLTVALGPAGGPQQVVDVQQLVISRAGAYIVRELGPARKAEGLGDTVPPILELGQVVWQGFSPGTRTLRARLTLDPGIEANRLPMSVTLAFHDLHGRPRALADGATATVDGIATVTLHNATAVPRTVAVGVARADAAAAVLDRLYAAAAHPHAAVPPYAGDGLPRSVPGSRGADVTMTVVAPLRVTGFLGVAGGTGSPLTGPGTTPAPGGARIAGTLDGDAAFDVRLRAGQRLAADLDVRPWLDPRTLAPPAASWRSWAQSGPAPSAVRDATTTLVSAAASAARAAEYSPYLQADTPGPDLTGFRYVMAAPTATPRAATRLPARPGGIAATAVAVVAIAGNAALLWREL